MFLSIDLYIYIFIIHIFAFYLKGVAGFGNPIVSSSAMSLFLDTKYISPITLCVSLPANGYYAWKNRKHFDAKKLIPITAAVMLGTIPGTFILTNAPSDIIKAILGLVILGAGVEMAMRSKAKQQKYNKWIMYGISFFSGITGGLYSMSFFFVAYLERTTVDRHSFRGSVCFIFVFENIFRVFVYLIGGLFTIELFYMILAAIPGVVLGMLFAYLTDKKISEKTVRKLVIIAFMAGGVSALVNALIILL